MSDPLRDVDVLVDNDTVMVVSCPTSMASNSAVSQRGNTIGPSFARHGDSSRRSGPPPAYRRAQLTPARRTRRPSRARAPPATPMDGRCRAGTAADTSARSCPCRLGAGSVPTAARRPPGDRRARRRPTLRSASSDERRRPAGGDRRGRRARDAPTTLPASASRTVRQSADRPVVFEPESRAACRQVRQP